MAIHGDRLYNGTPWNIPLRGCATKAQWVFLVGKRIHVPTKWLVAIQAFCLGNRLVAIHAMPKWLMATNAFALKGCPLT